MRGALLDGANLENASMVKVDLHRGQIAEVGWKLRGAKLSAEEKERGGELKENIGNADLSNAKAQSADLQAADLQSANFENANLSKANLTQAKLGDAILKGANLSETNLSEANLQSTVLDGANMRGAILNATNMAHASVENVVVPESLSHLDETIRSRMVKHHIWIRTNGAEGRPADLHGVDLGDINLRGVNLSGMNMKNANLHSVNFSDTICMFIFFKILTSTMHASRMLTWMPPILKNAY